MSVDNQEERPKLIRAIGRWDLLAMTINGIIGAGIFGLPSVVAKLVGVASPIAYIGCALIVGLIVLCFAEVSSLFAGTGGPYIYARAAFGNFIGFEVGWMLWLARLTAFAANCNQFIAYLGYFYPVATNGWARALIVILYIAALATINVRGVRQGTRVINLFTVGKLLPLALFIVVGLFFLDARNFSGAPQFDYSNIGKSFLVLIYAFTGFEYAVIPAGEAKDPRRDMPMALLSGVAIITVFYILIQIVCVGTLPTLATATRPLAEAGERFLGSFGGSLISLGALLSITGNLSTITLAAPRLTYAFSEDGNMPRVFGVVHPRFRTPYISIVFFALVSCVLTLRGTFEWLVTLSAIARTLCYVATCLTVPVLRKKALDSEARFTLPGGLLIPVLATGLSIWLLTNSSAANLKLAGYSILSGALIFFLTRLSSHKQTD